MHIVSLVLESYLEFWQVRDEWRVKLDDIHGVLFIYIYDDILDWLWLRRYVNFSECHHIVSSLYAFHIVACCTLFGCIKRVALVAGAARQDWCPTSINSNFNYTTTISSVFPRYVGAYVNLFCKSGYHNKRGSGNFIQVTCSSLADGSGGLWGSIDTCN